jgi:glycolate oxidase
VSGGEPANPLRDDPALRARLARELRQIVGAAHVIDAPEELLAYEYDATIDRAQPDLVVLPASTEEVAAVLRACAAAGAPVVPRGSGTGLAGGALAVIGGVVVATARMTRIRELDVEERLAVVEPGVINLALQEAAAEHGLRYAPDPSSQRICSIGGNVATNAGGPHTLAHGSTVNHVLGVELVLPDGRVTWLGGRQLDAPGIDLRALVVGSEGTLGIVTAACVRLLPQPEAVRTMLAVFDTVEGASEAVSAIVGRGVIPVALEMLDAEIIRAVESQASLGYPLDAGAVLLVEVEGLAEQVEEDAATVLAALEGAAREVRTAHEEAERERLWEGRKAGIGALGAISPNFYLLDGVVPRTKLPAVMRQVLALSERYGFRCANIFHAGDGNLHPNIMFDELEPGAAARVLELGGEILRVCVDAGGSITGEHGIGLEKRSYVEWIFDPPDLDAMTRVRDAFASGPGGAVRFNPCKLLPVAHGCAQGHAGDAPRPRGVYI